LALLVYLRNERARRVDNAEVASLRVGLDGAGHAMSTEDREGAVRDFREIFDEAGALGFEVFDDMAVVNDFMAHVDRPIALRE
jgi:hypothetical protein